MALTISIEGKGVIANSDGLSDSAGGSWGEDGGGSISLSTETYKYGSSCVAGAYSNKSGFHYYDIGSGSELDFGASGTEENQLIYLWVFNPTPSLNESKANNGLRIRLGTDLSNYREFMILSSDDWNEWDGRWKVFVLDPTKTGSWADTGTFSVSSVRYIGVYMDAVALAKGDNIFISQIAVGKGLRITGTSSSGWQDLVDYCTDYANRAWGMVEKRGSTIYVKGKIFIGSTSQTAVTSFSDVGRLIQFEKSEYWDGSAWSSTMPVDACGIVVEDAAGYPTTFQDGVLVGADNGRSGSSIIGNDNENVILSLHGGSNAGSATLLYGTNLKSIYGPISLGNNSGHKVFGCSFVDCSQFDPVGAPVIRNCTFAETADADAALLWNENIDIQNCSFIANTIGAAIEMPSAAGSPYTWTTLSFSGNTYDCLNSSGSSITVQKAGSNPTTYEGVSVSFQASSSLYFLVQDENKNPIATANLYINDDDTGAAEVNTATNASGIVSTSYSGGVSAATLRVRKYGFRPFKDTIDISSDVNRTITLAADPQQT